MLFNSWQFLIFFPVTVLLYYVVPGRLKNICLLLANCIFYGSAGLRGLLVLLLCGIYVLVGLIKGALYCSYFPVVSVAPLTMYNCTVWLAYLALCLTPLAIDIAAERRWNGVHAGVV